MTFGENYFLIEAYAMDMTDKLAIVKEFSCGASRSARVLFVWAFQLNVLFALVSVLMVMFTQHSLPSSESLSNTNNILLLPRDQHNKCFSWHWKAIYPKGFFFYFIFFFPHQNRNQIFWTIQLVLQQMLSCCHGPLFCQAKHNETENLPKPLKWPGDKRKTKTRIPIEAHSGDLVNYWQLCEKVSRLCNISLEQKDVGPVGEPLDNCINNSVSPS